MTENKKLLEVTLNRYDNIIYGKILYQDDKLRSQPSEQFQRPIKFKGGYAIVSQITPGLNDRQLSIMGGNRSHDHLAFCYRYNSPSTAAATIAELEKLIDEVNNSSN